MICKERVKRLLNNLNDCSVTTWTTPQLRKYTGITGWDVWQLQRHRFIPRIRRSQNKRYVWTCGEMRIFLYKVLKLIDRYKVKILPLHNNKYLKRYSKGWKGLYE